MKAMLFTLGGVSAMILISIASGLQCKKYDPIVSDHPMIWSTDRRMEDGRIVTYYWYDPTGDYPYTKDTCCLDSIVNDNDPNTRNCWANAYYDSIERRLNLVVQCDSLPVK